MMFNAASKLFQLLLENLSTSIRTFCHTFQNITPLFLPSYFYVNISYFWPPELLQCKHLKQFYSLW